MEFIKFYRIYQILDLENIFLIKFILFLNSNYLYNIVICNSILFKI